MPGPVTLPDVKARLRPFWLHLRQDIPQPSVVRLLYPTGVVFVHVPKCGGTSVESGLRGAYRFSRLRIDSERSAESVRDVAGDDPLTVRDMLQKASVLRSHLLQYALTCGYACITGHAPLRPGVIDAYRASHRFVTILRDPVKRFKSHFEFNSQGDQGGAYNRIEEDLDAFLETPRAQDFGRMFIKYFSGVETGRDYELSDAIERSKETLAKMSVIGFVDRMEAFAGDLNRSQGRRIRIGHENRTRTLAGPRPAYTAEQERKIEALCAPDLEIYAWARARADGSAPP